MAMNYTTLIGAKSVPGSIRSWTAQTLIDVEVIVDEAQALLYSLLRTREMMTDVSFSLAQGQAYYALPARFLDPIGRLRMTSLNHYVRGRDANAVAEQRNYENSSGTLGTDPFTTFSGLTLVNVAKTGHGFNLGSSFYTAGASAVGGVTITGTFPIVAIATDVFAIDIASLGVTATSSATGGGSAVTFMCDNLTQGIPLIYGIWNECINFDVALAQQTLCRLQYYQSLPLLSASNPTNFLTSRYPHLLRNACVAQVADFLQNDSEYQKGLTRLTALVQRVNAENDGVLRGLELDTLTP